jgi:two-component system, NarL family, nitrate/nitrite response regulator NarL
MLGVARVAIVDDHPLYRAGIRQAIDATSDMEVVAEGADAVDALHMAASKATDMILLDLNIPGGGIEAARSIAKLHPQTKIVFLTNSESEENMSAVMQLGAFGYIVKGIGGEELVSILRQVLQGEAYVTPSLAAGALRSILHPRTTDCGADSD